MKKINNNCCKDCYIEVRKYNIGFGIFMTVFMLVIMIIPFVNVWFFYNLGREDFEEGNGFWGKIWFKHKKMFVLKSTKEGPAKR